MKQIQEKIYQMLKPSGWHSKLNMFIMGSEFEEILNTLYKESQAKKHFTPVIKDIFNAFIECPYQDLKVVFIGQDLFSQVDYADGLLFSCSKLSKEEPAMKYLFDEIERTVYPQGKVINNILIPRDEYDKDLRRWANQGVLLLNIALTTEIGLTKPHYDLWKSFQRYLFEILNTYNSGIIYVFLGNESKEWIKYISGKSNFKFYISHPTMGKYNDHWDCANIFNQINNILQTHYKSKIIW